MLTIEKDYSEKVLVRIQEIRKTYNVDMVEATTMFCAESDIDPGDLVKQLKPNDILQLRQAAIEGAYVRKQTAVQGAVLPL